MYHQTAHVYGTGAIQAGPRHSSVPTVGVPAQAFALPQLLFPQPAPQMAQVVLPPAQIQQLQQPAFQPQALPQVQAGANAEESWAGVVRYLRETNRDATLHDLVGRAVGASFASGPANDEYALWTDQMAQMPVQQQAAPQQVQFQQPQAQVQQAQVQAPQVQPQQQAQQVPQLQPYAQSFVFAPQAPPYTQGSVFDPFYATYAA